MREISQNITCGKETINLVLQFPEEEQDTILLQKEVKAILITELQEQIKNITQCRKEEHTLSSKRKE